VSRRPADDRLSVVLLGGDHENKKRQEYYREAVIVPVY